MYDKDKANKHINSTNFLITIYHQDNYSYQGMIEWLDTGKKLHFRSEIEMLNLIEDAVEVQHKTKDTLRTWDDTIKIKAL